MDARLEARGGRRFEVDRFAGDGVGEVEVMRVEEVASIAGEAGKVFEGLAGGAVEGVSGERVADGGEVDSDLVGAAGVEGDRKGGGGGG